MNKYFGIAMEKWGSALPLAGIIYLIARFLEKSPPADPYIAKITNQLVEPIALITLTVATVILIVVYLAYAILGETITTRTAAKQLALETLSNAGVVVMFPAAMSWVAGQFIVGLFVALCGLVPIMLAEWLRDKLIPKSGPLQQAD